MTSEAKPITISNGALSVDIATAYGPRITGLVPTGGTNLFAELGDLGIDLADGDRYVFRGGHRLWLAPEVPAFTYVPDNRPVTTGRDRNATFATAAAAGIEKSIIIEVGASEAIVTVEHTVTNRMDESISVAPWAITQLRTGGTAFLPVDRGPSDSHGLQANHAVVGWPYTDWANLGYNPAASVIQVDGDRESPTKIGTSLGRGWLAYVIDGWLFAKYARPGPATPVDLGAQAEIYANADFVELETLGTLTALEPEASVGHREVWRVWRAPPTRAEVPGVVESWNPWEAQ